MLRSAQPRNRFHQLRLGHCPAAGRRPVFAAANMEKNRAAGAWNWRIGVVSNVDEPMISEIARAHFFVAVIVRRIFWIDYYMPVVIRRTRIIAPDVSLGYVMER